MDDGHCGLPAEELVALTRELLEVPAELVETALSLELQGGAVIADDLDGRRCVFLAGLHRAEREIAEKLKALPVGKPPWPLIDADKAIPWVEKRTKLALAETQIEAVRVEGASDHRRSWRRQDNAGQLDPQDPWCEGHRNERRWSSGFHRRGLSGRPSRSLGGGAGTDDAAITGFVLADLGFLASRLPLL
jgi:hypothetical protein